MTGFSVTFERYFPHDDSEDICEPDESGFVIENVSLRDAMRLGLVYSYPLNNARCLSFYEWNDCTRDDIERGIKESRSLHFPDSLTESSRLRICRLLGAYGTTRKD